MVENSDTLHRWLARLQLRSTIGDEELAALRALPLEVSRCPANRDFVRLGERTTHACVVLSGLAARFDQTASGARQITALHIPGDAADLHSVPLPTSASALQALTATEIARIPHGALRELIARFPSLAMAFWRDTMVDSAILAKWALNIGRASARQRMAHLLCELAVRYAAFGDSMAHFDFRATQTHLGDATGLTNVHVNRTLRALAADNVATVRTGMVQIHDWRRLADEADFDITYLHLPEDTQARFGLNR